MAFSLRKLKTEKTADFQKKQELFFFVKKQLFSDIKKQLRETLLLRCFSFPTLQLILANESLTTLFIPLNPHKRDEFQ
jgi:hypothetical protein